MLRPYKHLHIWIAALLVSILTACSSDDGSRGTQHRSMAFRATKSAPQGWNDLTRAGSSTGQQSKVQALPATFTTLHVSAITHGEDGVSKTLFHDLPIVKEDGKWTADKYYYPAKGSVDFVAYTTTLDEAQYTASVSPNLTSSTANTTFSTIEVDCGNNLDGEKELLYTEITKQECPNTEEFTTLNFKHSQTQLRFTFTAKDDNAAEYMKVQQLQLDDIHISGKATIDYTAGTTATVTWDSQQTTSLYVPDVQPMSFTKDEPAQLGREILALPHTSDTQEYPAKAVITYFIQKGTPTGTVTSTQTYACALPSAPVWENNLCYTYNFTCKLRRIEIDGTYEEDWNSEIGGGGYESEWNVEIDGTAYEVVWDVEVQVSAMEETWSTEMGSGAGENGWDSEIGTGAGEGGWNTETGASAGEDDWNSEAGAGANEEGWDSETGGSASEENWTEETGGNAFEAPWTPGEEIIIGGDPAPPAGE